MQDEVIGVEGFQTHFAAGDSDVHFTPIEQAYYVHHVEQLSGYAIRLSLEVMRSNLVKPAPVEVNVT